MLHNGSGPLARPGSELFAGPAQARALDWAATPLGPVNVWAPELRAGVRTMLASPVAMSLWCGPPYTLIYNDAYSRILGATQSNALGRSGAEVWDELWPALEPQFAQVRNGGDAICADEAKLTMERLEGGAAECGPDRRWSGRAPMPRRPMRRRASSCRP